MRESSSDSSQDDDWKKFADVAVTVADITSGYSKAAAKGQEKLNGKRKHRAASEGAPRGDFGDSHEQQAGFDSGLDGVSLQVRAALDAVLEKGFDRMWVDPSKLKTPGKKKSRSDGTGEQGAPDEPADSWVAFFKGVKPGTPCILEKPEEQPAAIPAQRRALLPHRQLTPEDDKQALEMAAAVAVEGKAIIAAAGEKWLGRRKLKRRLPLQGVVVDPKVYVPHDIRMARLLGQPIPDCPTC